jgi:hemerythrin
MMNNGSPAGEIRRVLQELIADGRGHFAAEEKLMADNKFPGLARHQKAHAVLLNEAVNLERQMAQGEAVGGLALLVFLQHWLIDHLRTLDRELGDFLSAKTEPPVTT